ncbi:MAG: heme lyase CcmF/NrfE family subunit [Pseudomonadales bacterium]
MQGTLPLYGAARDRAEWMAAGDGCARAQFLLILIAFFSLMTAFATSDFSVENVARNSHTLKPMLYKLSGVWGNHEGSLLLWVMILALFGAMVATFGTNLPPGLRARVVAVQGLIGVGFLSFILFTSNPFLRLNPAPAEGMGLNPVLQDPALSFHPPFLYLGYVGFSVAFSFAVAALIEGRVDPAWARWVRPWTLAAWCALTIGIAMGSWWAYYELGWGGWWFWDPVENASFMPWLVGTALIHSLAVTEKRGSFKSWTVLLAITTFSLSLLGAFIVRSGVLTSVHAFAVDPERGLFILGFLVVVVGGSLLLYASRAAVIGSRVRFGLLSREAFILVNNIVLVIAMSLVVLGTLYPLAYEAVTGGGKISVGVPYFNAGFVPLMLVLAAALGVVPALRWKRGDWRDMLRRLRWMAVGSLVLGVGIPLLVGGAVVWQVAVTLVLAFWIIGVHGRDLLMRLRVGLRRIPLGYWGMLAGHVGFAFALLGVAFTTQLSVEKDLRMSPGEVVIVRDVAFEFVGVGRVAGPNYQAERGTFSVLEGSTRIVLQPEKRRYLAGGSVMTEAAIDAGFTRDLYVSLGESLGDGDWAVRIQVKPFVRWIWFGGLLMAFGGGVAVFDARYRRLRKRLEVTAGAETVA